MKTRLTRGVVGFLSVAVLLTAAPACRKEKPVQKESPKEEVEAREDKESDLDAITKPAVEAKLPTAPGWLELYDLSLHRDVEGVAPQGLYIKGDVGPGKSLVPKSRILGSATAQPPETGVSRGWLELSGLRFHQMQESVAPVEPYVDGVLDEDGRFYPDTPYKIVGGPG